MRRRPGSRPPHTLPLLLALGQPADIVPTAGRYAHGLIAGVFPFYAFIVLRQSLQAMLEQLGVNVRDAAMPTANTAAVMVTANLPPFVTAGSRIGLADTVYLDFELLGRP